jgi:hypothetical protein
MRTLERFEALVDTHALRETLEAIEASLPVGVRPRQLRVRTLILGIVLALADGRPAHLSRVRDALVALDEADRLRLGVVVEWSRGEHTLTYRQVEYTFSLVVSVLNRPVPDGTPSDALVAFMDALVEASMHHVSLSTRSLAVDWSDLEAFARPGVGGAPSADGEASWGHRSAGVDKGELFFGYYFSAATAVREEGGEAVPELVRRMVLTSCAHDPVRAVVPSLESLAASGVSLGDVLVDSGYAHRLAENWALPMRRAGAQLVMDLHPHDRGTRGTFGGAICWNGNLYCPATPPLLFDLEPLARGASESETRAHDERAAELARYKLGRLSTDDADGYHRVMCPAAMGKLRCARRAGSLALSYDRPEITAPPDPAPRCCTQATLSVPPEVNAKTRQKHDYPSSAHRRSFARRTAVERTYSTMKDPASTDVTRGWCRVMGLGAISVLLACAVVVRNRRVLDAFEERRRGDLRRQALGLEPKRRRRRRRTIDDLVAATPG